MYELIPDELKKLPNWVCWDAVPDEARGKIKKMPINPFTGGQAQSNNPQTWSDFNTALAASGRFTGLGFMFGNCPYFGVDIDNIADDIESFKNGDDGIVSEFVNALQSYTELSQSGNGIHIICRGTLPKQGRRRGNVEMYENGRFFVMTGNICAEYAEITDCTDRIKPLHEKYIGGGRAPQPKIRSSAAIPQTAGDILEAARNAKNGDAFSALYGGNYSAYASQSEADLALCNMLAFWCRRDPDMMDSLFRQSGLMRDKWDRKQSGTTYGAITIQRAIADCVNVYEPKVSSGFSVTFNDSGEPEEIESPKLYSFDDTGNAERFCDLFGDDVRYNYADKRWLCWDSRKWQADNDGEIDRVIDRSVEAMRAEAKVYEKSDEENGGDMLKQFKKHFKASRSHKAKKAVKEESQHLLPVLPKALDKHKYAFNTPNGILSLKNGEIVEHDRKYFLTKMSNVEYTDNADCPMWMQFLDDIFAGDKDLIRYIQKSVGYSMTGDTSEQCVFFLFGTGRNGKSTFLDVIRDIMGDYVTNIQPETIMIRSSQGSTINSDIARLKGARIVTTVEPNEGVRINEGLLKQLTGDDTVTARKLYSEEFEFKPEFKLWMTTNHKPIIRGTDTGIWRRIHMIPFTVQIPEEKIDRQLKSKLTREYAAILHWAVEGCLLWQSEGLNMPLAVLNMVKEYRREMDVISAFIEDRCVEGKNQYVKAISLYIAYSAWCDANNEYKMSNTKFGIEIAKKYHGERRNSGKYYFGISLIE